MFYGALHISLDARTAQFFSSLASDTIMGILSSCPYYFGTSHNKILILLNSTIIQSKPRLSLSQRNASQKRKICVDNVSIKPLFSADLSMWGSRSRFQLCLSVYLTWVWAKFLQLIHQKFYFYPPLLKAL